MKQHGFYHSLEKYYNLYIFIITKYLLQNQADMLQSKF
ncbi:hypothetical protein HBZC1_13460 [Helicobacter bizzozeronii CIII-1]|uniref:Uncharacterized protein n=1 Tax=Helicobacter bizzozeronii (strain CIII-1) TaxID=1002804 RepID=F8KTZ6_HELBC|nr:hypothetical protein HBZC1_13460 [Helicobacter bizzozeronii CIII-1]CCF81103.1 hypothetical protein HBZS_115520 [Helicobacter bizzozeronii CCUG 35545]